jgi:hypothetical protein
MYTCRCCCCCLRCAVVCPGVPTATSLPITNATWVAGCFNNSLTATCSAACTGDGSPPTATCTRTAGAATAAWTLTSAGTCTNTYRQGATCASINPGSAVSAYPCTTGFSLKSSPASINIASLTDVQAKTACCDTLYSATDTCGAAVTCPLGTTAKPGTGATPVNGLVVNGVEAVSRCCVQVGELGLLWLVSLSAV